MAQFPEDDFRMAEESRKESLERPEKSLNAPTAILGRP